VLGLSGASGPCGGCWGGRHGDMGPYYLRGDSAHQLYYRKLYASIYFQYLDLARQVRFALDECQSGARPWPAQNGYGKGTYVIPNWLPYPPTSGRLNDARLDRPGPATTALSPTLPSLSPVDATSPIHGIAVAGSLRSLPLRPRVRFMVQEAHMARLRSSRRWPGFPNHSLPILRAPIPPVVDLSGGRGRIRRPRPERRLGCPSQRGQTSLRPRISRL